MKNIFLFKHLSLLLMPIAFVACGQINEYQSPPGYDFNNPEKFRVVENLLEISGIALYKGSSDTFYAIEDEDGKLFRFHLGDKKPFSSKFGKRGDYEDIAICNEQVIVLRSDGVLFSFPFSEAGNKEIVNVREWKDILPPGEFEGMYADNVTGKLYILCKHCSDDNTKKQISGYIFEVAPDGTISGTGGFSVSVKDIEKISGEKKLSFHPSALAKNMQTQQWYIVSSVNKLLVVTDAEWKIKEVYPLQPALFSQPEGIAFDNDQNLYISNEGDELKSGDILKFKFQKQ